ncbi:Uncharacterised protein [uncultured Clostridium sp.]|uniref:LSM domain-containing protein n=2 Tax=Paraclostridium tenue TaxID=1737 RepID=A0ABP3XHD0_9FIRM|nr:Uncharacterised protein [uncultured Clostridium sp.]SCJ40680.1 Uncharacterised protein [uncultured Clostridium sp.]
MSLEKNNNRDAQNLRDKCERFINYHTMFTMQDGSKFDGIIEGLDGDCVIVLVGEDVIEQEGANQSNLQRQQGRPRRFRRFRRRRIPLSSLLTLSLLAYPFIAPPFPF